MASEPLVTKPKQLESERMGEQTSAILLFILLLAVFVGPRIRVGAGASNGLSADIRWQDLILVPCIAYLVLPVKRKSAAPLSRLFGRSLPVFIWGVVLVVGLHLILNPEINAVRRIAFAGRSLELLIIAAAIANLYLRADRKAMSSALTAIHTGAVLNIGWMLYQYLTGNVGTLVGSQVGDMIESYGPKLVGEGSAFGTGQYYAFLAAVGVAEYRSGVAPRPFAIFLVGAAFLGSVLSESRISVAAVILMMLILLGFSRFRERTFSVTGLFFGTILGLAAFAIAIPLIGNRFTVGSLEAGLGVRVSDIWGPLVAQVLQNPLLGIGPGGLIPTSEWSEAHNIYLRAALDFGVVFGALFLLMFVRTLVVSYRSSKLSDDGEVIFFSFLAFLVTFSVMVSGLVQDALTGVMSSHLTMVSIGLYAGARASGGARATSVIPMPFRAHCRQAARLSTELQPQF